MKFDPNLIRDILISVSESISPDEYGFVSQIYPVDIAQNKLSDYSQNEVLYWIRQLMNSGILIEGSKYVDEPISHIKDLSLAGYQFIENTSHSMRHRIEWQTHFQVFGHPSSVTVLRDCHFLLWKIHILEFP